MATVSKKARVLEINYLDKSGAYMSDESGEFIEFKVTGQLNKSFKLYPGLMTDEMQKRAMFHGFNQKVRDAAASKDKTEQQKYDDMLSVWQVLSDGAWDKAREASTITNERLAKAMVRAYVGTKYAERMATEEMAMAVLATSSDEQKKKLAGSPNIMSALATMRAEELAAKAQGANDGADALLDELMAEEEENDEEEDTTQ